jgi:glycosyltransferase involved in cell wall biosynthesis
MMLPFIDVVIRTFNRASLLKQATQSLLTQNYPPERYQIIVVDDGSTDETWTMLQELAASHSNVRALRVDHAGSYAARNEGWRNGNGDIVAFTDDDCVAHPPRPRVFPNREQWILENAADLQTNVIFNVGALMDYLAGEVPTPPRWMGRAGLEWLFRLLSQPGHLWRRYLVEPWFVLRLFLSDYARRLRLADRA